jgi:signal transduction histidine kinase
MGFEMRIRVRSIRSTIAVLLLPPLVSLVALWLFATSITLPAALRLVDVGTIYSEIGRPTESLVAELQHERKLAQVYLGTARRDPAAFTAQRARTDAVIASWRRRATSGSVDDAATADGRVHIQGLLSGLDRLVAIRDAVETGQTDRPTAQRQYSQIIDGAFGLFLAMIGVEDQTASKDARLVIGLARGRELLAQEDALLAGAASTHRLSTTEPGQLSQLIGAQRLLYADNVPELRPTDRARFERVFATETARDLRGLEDRLGIEARAGAPVPIDVDGWNAAYDRLNADLRQAEFAMGEDLVTRGRPIGVAVMVRLVVVGVLGLLAILLSIFISVRASRSLIRRLTTLRQVATELAEQRLPTVVAKLRAGEAVDVGAQEPVPDLGPDEIGAVGRAFGAVQRTALESAVHEARLRSGLSNVFLNIARRSQTLLHRQLTLLDRMERRAADPEELADLFRVDHLATRMRRHAEDLVILAGAAPGRGWRNPVPAVDVVRGAVSEVEDYARVIVAVPDASVTGRAVADVIHLLAELIENATSFSPPHTQVHVTGDLVPNGLAIEIEDRGLGMTPATLVEANARLARPPEFDPTNSARLGLLVVSSLAARHGIRVTLRPSPYGGVTAIVLLPPEVVVTGRHRALDGPTAGRDLGTEITRPLPRKPAGTEATAPSSSGTAATGTAATGTATVASAASPSAAAGEPELTEDGLPRRQRPGSLPRRTAAPAPPVASAGAGGNPDPGDAVVGRTPEQARAMMSSLQSGLARGRRDAAALPPEPHPNGVDPDRKDG